MRKEMFVGLVVALALVAIVGNAFAWGNGCGRGGDANSANGCASYAQEFAKLTDEQKNDLKELHQKFIDETATLRESIASKHEELRALIESAAPDKEAIDTLVGAIGALKKEIMDKKIDMALAAKNIAPELNLPMMGFGGKGGCSSMMSDGCTGTGCGGAEGCPGMAGGKCGSGGCKSMMGKMGKGMGRFNCPAINGQADSTTPAAEPTSN
ncbi:MAG: Spy/CpxP family protein refolding chaperone [Desulfamplus sp.]|nr:Spy/CpxP family protein refolding chaperone [Desulfamplus sp.]